MSEIEDLEYICKILDEKSIDVKWLFKKQYSSIKQALIKAQEQEEENIKLKGQVAYLTEVATDFRNALKIIFEKYVDVDFLKSADTFEEYNRLIKFKVFLPLELTEEEFNLVKRYVNE